MPGLDPPSKGVCKAHPKGSVTEEIVREVKCPPGPFTPVS